MIAAGYRTVDVMRLTGVTFKQLDYWDRTAVFQPSIAQANGSGSQRVYSHDDVRALRIMRALVEGGCATNPNTSHGGFTLRRAAELARTISDAPAGSMAVITTDRMFLTDDDDEVLEALRTSGGAPVRVFTAPDAEDDA